MAHANNIPDYTPTAGPNTNVALVQLGVAPADDVRQRNNSNELWQAFHHSRLCTGTGHSVGLLQQSKLALATVNLC